LPSQPPIRIGTRASKLARTQSGLMQQRIAAALGAPLERAEEVAPLVLITTSGDRIQDRRLLEAGGKGLFVKEIEEALLDGRIDAAVHSMKDVPAELPPGLVIGAIPEREDPRDALLSRSGAGFDDLPRGARLGTASLRRQAQALHRRPDLVIEMLRGNVDTRLAKLEAGSFDAILLAAAGLNRLGLQDHITELLDPERAPPAPGQGALAIEVRAGDIGADWLAALRHGPTALAVAAERGALEALEGSCRTAIGAHARIMGERLELTVEALTPDGADRFRREAGIALGGSTLHAEARALGLSLGQDIRAAAGDRIVWA
jgi:hydroxymethylbilane synthase